MKQEKYMWVTKDVEDYYKKQAQELGKMLGMKIPPKTAAKIVHESIIMANNIKVSDLINVKQKKKVIKKLKLL